ncbi:MAG TPA: hypothetical protein VN643_19945 [Pyrinomonadaceae bacterium]|nr:hypothetical protein [Pyrinomonadaceae bacterium]
MNFLAHQPMLFITNLGMSGFLADALEFIQRKDVILGISLFVVSFAASIGIISLILVKLPPDYFQESYTRSFMEDRRPALRWAGLIGKNVLGVILVLLGIVMSIPGIPGQGVLTILLGIMLLDLPGKRRLEQKILGQPKVLEKINRLRHKFSKPPIMID